MKRLLFLLIALGYTAGVLHFSWTPAAAHTGSETAVIVKRWLFNLLHPPVYAGMMVAWYSVIRPRWGWSRFTALTAVGIAALIGVVGEIGQLWVPNRYADFLDGSFNVLGASLGAWLVYYVTTRRKARTSAAPKVQTIL